MIDDITDVTVHSMQILSTHFEESEAKIRVLFIFENSYTIMDIKIVISSFKEFIVKIIPVTKKKIPFKIAKVHMCNKTEAGRYHFLVAKKERKPNVCLFKIELDSKESNDKLTVLWTSQKLETDNIRAKIGIQLLGILDNTKNVLYIYDLVAENYSGFIDLKRVLPDIESESKNFHNEFISDLLFSRNHAKGSLVVFYKDTILMFSQINTESLDSIQEESWTLIHKFDNVLKLDKIKSIKMQESYYGKLLFIINNKYFLSKTRFTADVDDTILGNRFANEGDNNKKKVTFEGLFTLFQQSKPIYHPQMLKQLFLKGHMNLILKILIKLKTLLSLDSKMYKIPSFCEIPLDLIVKELNLQSKEPTKKIEQPKQTQDTAASLFNDLFAFDAKPKESESLFAEKKQEETKRDPNVKLGIDEEFEEV